MVRPRPREFSPRDFPRFADADWRAGKPELQLGHHPFDGEVAVQQGPQLVFQRVKTHGPIDVRRVGGTTQLLEGQRAFADTARLQAAIQAHAIEQIVDDRHARFGVMDADLSAVIRHVPGNKRQAQLRLVGQPDDRTIHSEQAMTVPPLDLLSACVLTSLTQRQCGCPSDLTSTYFESDPPFPEDDKRKFGYSRDKRPDCLQVVIALIVTPEGFPLGYEVMPGNTSDKTTLKDFLAKIEKQYGKARRIWVMDRGHAACGMKSVMAQPTSEITVGF